MYMNSKSIQRAISLLLYKKILILVKSGQDDGEIKVKASNVVWAKFFIVSYFL